MLTRVLVVEDNPEVREEYRKLIENYDNLCLAGEADGVQEALSILRGTQVDAVILDLELGGENGFMFLQAVQELEMEKPFIMVVTKVISKRIHNMAHEWGADFVCVKGGKNFSLDYPLSLVAIASPYQESKERARARVDGQNERTKREIYRRNIQETLVEMGFSAGKQGTNQCAEAILYIVLGGQEDIGIMKQVYPEVARIYSTKATNVEINIRKSIAKVWTREPKGKLRQWYPYEWSLESGRPTNTEFLWNMARKWM